MKEFWQTFLAIITSVGLINGVSIWINRFVLSKVIKDHSDQYRDHLVAATKQCEDLANEVRNYQSVERQLLELKADLPISYVRKEDFIRHEVTINAKLDRIYEVLSQHNKQGGC